MRGINMIGEKYGKLTVVSLSGKNKSGQRTWKSICDCGNKRIVAGIELRKGRMTSCGCQNKHKTTHGLSSHPLYLLWRNIKTRCYNSSHEKFQYYGGRGIKLCKIWEKEPSNFIKWAENSGWEKGLEIDRINNDKGYSPDNCRFVTKSINNFNTRLLSTRNTSGFRGVHRVGNRYYACVIINKKNHHLGSFKDIKAAAKVRDKFILENNIPSPLNFP